MQYNDFTLTVNAVNDAPDLLQPLEELEILDDSWAAAWCTDPCNLYNI